MSIRFVYRCDGCDNIAESGRVTRRFESFSGRDYGFGRFVIDADPIRDAPDGWIAFCGIGCTYCEDCAKALDSAALSTAAQS